MRRNAGSYVRSRMVRLGMWGTAGAGVLIGLGIAPLFYLVGVWAGRAWAVAAYIGTVAVVYFILHRLDRPANLWNFDNLQKGLDAETRVGQTIERAITAENCAVAHSVKEIASVGDIDHIVATPVAIWVIETKYQRVPPEAFPKVLSRIAANTKAVRQWAPMGTTVRGCLVLAYEEKIKRREYSSEKETIIAYTPDMLVREMSREARENQRIDGQVSESIWRLGRVIE